MKSVKKPNSHINGNPLEELQRIASGEELGAFVFSTQEHTPIARVCALVTQELGYDLPRRCLKEESIVSICKIGRLGCREIFLPDNWWEQDHGPLVGFYDEKPVALLHRGKGYFAFGPSLGKAMRVVDLDLEKFADKAHMLYPPLPEDVGSLHALWHTLTHKNLKDYLLLALAGALAIFTGFFIPFSNKILFDRVIPHYDLSLLAQVAIGFCVAITASTLFFVTRSFIGLRLNTKISHMLQMRLWNHLLRLPVAFFRLMPKGDLIQRTLIFETIRRAVTQNTIITFFDSIFSAFYIFLMFFFSWQLALLAVGVILIATGVTLSVSLLKIHYDKAILESNASINSFLISMIRGILKLKTAGAENYIFSSWAQIFSTNQNLTLKSKFLQAINITTNKLLSSFLIGLVYIVAIWKRSHDPLTFTLGTYLAFIASLTPFASSILGFLDIGSTLISLVPFWKRVQPLLEAKAEDDIKDQPPGILKGHIQLKDVSFRYQENMPNVLKNVTLEIQPNEFIGIAGRSGSGKSTLCRLLIGFEEPQNGQVLLDSSDLASLISHEVREQISVVLQQNAICTGSIYENIACGPNRDYEDLAAVLQMTTFNQDMARFPAGLQTFLTSGAPQLSGGEKQKLLLSRALLRKPKILILDEGLNSLSSGVQQHIIAHLKQLEMTRVFVTHQLNLLKEADKIILFDQGEIAQIGTYQELIKDSPLFRELIESQSI